MSDEHFSFSTGEVTVFLLLLLIPPTLVMAAITCAVHWIGDIKWVYSVLIGAGTVAAIIAALYTVGKLRGF